MKFFAEGPHDAMDDLVDIVVVTSVGSPFSNFFPMGHGPYELTQTHGSWGIRQPYDRLYGP